MRRTTACSPGSWASNQGGRDGVRRSASVEKHPKVKVGHSRSVFAIRSSMDNVVPSCGLLDQVLSASVGRRAVHLLGTDFLLGTGFRIGRSAAA